MISKDKLENYFAVISIMETNLAEYSKILQELIIIQGEIQAMNVIESYPSENELAQLTREYSNGNEEDTFSRLMKKAAKTVMRRPSVGPSAGGGLPSQPSSSGIINPFASRNSAAGRLSISMARTPSFNRQASFSSRPPMAKGSSSVSFSSSNANRASSILAPNGGRRPSILRNTQGENSVGSANTADSTLSAAVGGQRPSIIKSVKF